MARSTGSLASIGRAGLLSVHPGRTQDRWGRRGWSSRSPGVKQELLGPPGGLLLVTGGGVAGPGGHGTHPEEGAGTAESRREGREGEAGPVRTSRTDPVGTLDGHAGHPLSSVQIQGKRLGDWGPYSPFPERKDQESEHLTSLSRCEDQPSQHLRLWFLTVRREGSDTSNSSAGARTESSHDGRLTEIL